MPASNAVELKGVRKDFGTCVANADVSFAVPAGSIHAIVGENGAGKSTAMKILYGQYRADGGEILVEGQPRVWRSSADAIQAGLGMVHQHFMLAETHTALENIIMGTHGFPFFSLGAAGAEKKINAIMAEFGLEVPLGKAVGDLPVGVQQRIEILKLLYRDSKILILDEPTAVLAPTEIEGLFRILRGMAAKGKTILIITHKLKEVMALAERVTVFRAGRVVAERKVAETNLNEIACLMVGREIRSGEDQPRGLTRPDILLQASLAKSRETRLEEISFQIRAGEILGVAGVEGNGQSELLRLLLDPRAQLREGALSYFGKSVERQSAAGLRAAGVAVFPEDRLREALLLDQDLTSNFILGRQRSLDFRRGGIFLSETKARALALAAVQAYDVRPGRLEGSARDLSGGNQQKLVVARELQSNPRLLFASQPTRGVDIGAVEFIHEKIMQLRDSGTGVLLISSELDEVLKLSDRLLVLYRGRVVGAFERKDFDERSIGLLMAGGSLEAQ
jgi:general nucleoside transport system ATP-binding protein